MLFSDISVLDASFHCKTHQYVATEGKKSFTSAMKSPRGILANSITGITVC